MRQLPRLSIAGKRPGLSGLALVLSFGLAACGQATPPLAASPPQTAQEVLIKLRAPQAAAQLGTLARQAGATLAGTVSQPLGLYRLRLRPGTGAGAALEALNASALVAYAEANPSLSLTPPLPELAARALPQTQLAPGDFRLSQLQPNDSLYDRQWNLPSAGIDKAWALSRGEASVTVAVIDSGVDPDHPELAGHLLPLEDVYREQKGSDIYSRGELRQDYNGRDGNGHGTHVTGIIAASLDNGAGIAGIAGGGVRVLPIKATDYAGNSDAGTLTAAFQRAIDKGADVINFSIGGPASRNTRAFSEVIKTALARNIAIVSATGNESVRNIGALAPMTIPAAFDGVIAVGAHTEFDKVANYSNGGAAIDLLAPGGAGKNASLREGRNIWSTWPTYQPYEFLLRGMPAASYLATSGTSMACPHVTGVVALLLAREPKLTPAQIRSRLIATADDLGPPGFDEDSGYGKLNAWRALNWSEDDAHD